MPTDAKNNAVPTYDDIVQGALGDCYYLSSCATTASK